MEEFGFDNRSLIAIDIKGSEEITEEGGNSHYNELFAEYTQG